MAQRGRPRKIRPELEGAVIEPTQKDIEDDPEDLVEIEGVHDLPVHLGDGRKLAKGQRATVTQGHADELILSGRVKLCP